MSDFKRFVFVVLELRPGGNLSTHGVFESPEDAVELCNRIKQTFSGPGEKSSVWISMTQYRPKPPMEP